VIFALKKPFNLGLVIQNFKNLLVLGFFLAVHFTFFVLAVKDTTILNATVLVNTTPFFSVLVSSFIFRSSPSRTQFVGLSASFVGVCMIAVAAGGSANSGGFSPSLKGDVEALLAAVVESLYLSLGRTIRRQMNIFSLMVPIYALTAIVVSALSLFGGGLVVALPSQWGMLLSLLGLGLIPTAIAHTLYFSSLSNLKSFETATMALLEPIGATLLGVLVFREMPAPVFLLGAIVVGGGIIFIGRNQN
jgi:drug/metabolite transporter (DMT)-like permease